MSASEVLRQRNSEREEMEELNNRLLKILKRLHLKAISVGLEDQWEKIFQSADHFFSHLIAEKTKKFEEDHSSLKTNNDALKHRHHGLIGSLDNETGNKKRLRDQIEAMIDELSKIEMQISTKTWHHKHLEEDVAYALKDKDALDGDIKNLQQDIKKQKKETKHYQDICKQLEADINEDESKYKKEIEDILKKKVTLKPDASTDLDDFVKKIRERFLDLDRERKAYLANVFSDKTKLPSLGEFPEKLQIENINKEIIQIQMTNNDLNIKVHKVQAEIENEKSNSQCLKFQKTHLDQITEDNRAFREKLQVVEEINSSLNDEIKRYKDMLDSKPLKQVLPVQGALHSQSQETTSVSSAITQVSHQDAQIRGNYNQQKTQIVGHESTTKQRTRTHKGRVLISEIPDSVKYIELKNVTENQDHNLTGWKLERTLGNNNTVKFTFSNYVLKAGKSVRIYSYGQSTSVAHHLDNFFETEKDTAWQTETGCVTILYNKDRDVESKYEYVLSP